MARVAHNKTLFDEVKNIFSLTEYTLIDEKYEFKKKLNYFDSEGYFYESHLYDLKNGITPKKFGNGSKYTTVNIKNYLKINGGKFILLDKKINSVTQIASFKCTSCGNILLSDFNSFRKNKKCNICNENRWLSIEKIIERVEDINPNILILSKEYDPRKKIKCKCKIDAHEWSASVNKLSVGKGCPECKRRLHVGENNNKWKGGITPLSNKLRRSIYEWKRDSLIKFNYKCVISGSKEDIVIHHLYPFNKILKEALEEYWAKYTLKKSYNYKDYFYIEPIFLKIHSKYKLGVLLSSDIHKEFHRIYGNENFTEDDFNEFYKTKTGKVFGEMNG